MVERGLSWDAAMEIFISHKKTNDGFYICNVSYRISEWWLIIDVWLLLQNAPTVILVCDAAKKRADTGEKLFHVYRPNVGLSAKLEVFEDLKKRFRKVCVDVRSCYHIVIAAFSLGLARGGRTYVDKTFRCILADVPARILVWSMSQQRSSYWSSLWRR